MASEATAFNFHTSPPPKSQIPQIEEKTCWGRTFSENGCCSEATLYKVIGIFGLILFLTGILFLVGYSGTGAQPGTPLKHIADWTSSFSGKLGCDALTIGALVTCIGLGFTLAGFGFAFRASRKDNPIAGT